MIEWQTFWDQFSATVDSTDLPVVSKFTYVRSLLDGEAKQAIEGLSITNGHYKTACSILKERYGRKERIIFTHIQELLNISIPSKCSISMLWSLNDTLQAHMRSLDSLGIKGDQYGVILTPLVLSRLPVEMRLEWARDGEKHESDLPFLMKFINTEIKRRERSQVYSDSISTIPMLCEKKRKCHLRQHCSILPKLSRQSHFLQRRVVSVTSHTLLHVAGIWPKFRCLIARKNCAVLDSVSDV